MKPRLYLVTIEATVVTVLAPSVQAIRSYFGKAALVWDDFDGSSFAEPDFDLTRPLGLPLSVA